MKKIEMKKIEMKKIEMKKLGVVGILALVHMVGLSKAGATTVKIEQAGITVQDSVGTALNINLAAKAGYWRNGFAPTLNNITSWDENFIAVNGSWASTTKKFSVAFTMNDNQIVGGTQSAASATGTTLAANTQLYLIGSNSAYNSGANTTLATFESYIGASSSSQVFILSDSSWIMRAGTATSDPTPYTLAFTSGTQLATFGGTTFGKDFSFNAGTGLGTLQLIPEPSSASLLALGVAGLVALRARRKS